MGSSELEAAALAAAYILINMGTGVYLITALPDHIIHVCIGMVVVNIAVVVLLEKYGIMALEDVDAAAAKKKDDDYAGAEGCDADDAAAAEAVDPTACHEIIYEINMSDMIDIILDKLQERVELSDVQHLRETLLAAYCAMNTSPINVDIIDTVVDMVLLCIKQINVPAEAAPAPAPAVQE